jgi:pimeloyl-ACP methyl ester carboxylesterase
MIAWIFGILVFGLILWFAFLPIPTSGLKSHPNPVTSYEEAIKQIKSMQEADNEDLVHDVCITKLFDHDAPTEHVLVLFHGFSTCPEQFHDLGKQYFDAGYNVFIPRLPYHGLKDRLTDALTQLTAEDLAAFGDKVIDIAHGLGKKITVMGISAGGTLAAWLAQNRADIDYAFPIAALFGLSVIPSALTKLFTRIFLTVPVFFIWWDPRTKAENPYSIYYAYPRYPMRGVAEIMRLALATQAEAESKPPAAGSITMVINDAEPAVSNTELMHLLKSWQKHGKGNLSEFHFESAMKLPHDIITPGTPNLPIEEIHPRLISAVKDSHAKSA